MYDATYFGFNIEALWRLIPAYPLAAVLSLENEKSVINYLIIKLNKKINYIACFILMSYLKNEECRIENHIEACLNINKTDNLEKSI